MKKVLLFTIGFLLLVFFESFLLHVFSFSLFIILVLSSWKKIEDLPFYLFITLFSIVFDTVLHTSLGLHMIVIALVLLVTHLLWYLIPRDGVFGFIPVFLSVFLYYILSYLLISLLQDRVLIPFTWDFVLNTFIKSLLSIPVYLGIQRGISFFRKDDTGGKIKLK
ncbi:hypothetical protein GX888_02210 [Candidatus Dojkabacteria bacterium]|uniref:Rod shape-determining protein MreD n=1 Tax=Candidatus Dojkabacteria bacterium TaxID=2099670 RepID=A0A847VDE9_9BACT|nr:hypothetical protein [Candidatus Dojkabacteria bacterium]